MIPKIASTVAATLGPCFLEETPLGEKPKAARTLLCGRGSRPVPQSLGMALNRTQERGDALLRCLKQLFDDGTYSDLTIVCGDNHHKVHKAIVCPRSEFFASACNGPFQEGESSVIHLPEDDPFAVKAMLHYLYHLDYPFMAVPVVDADEAAMSQPFTFRCAYQPNEFTQTDPATGPGRAPLSKKAKKKTKESRCAQPCSQRPESVPPTPNLCLYAKVYALGEKFGIKDLKGLALDKFHAEAEHYWQSDDFLHAIQEVYNSTIDEDRLLRDIVVEVVNAHLELLD
ncbi:BTB/POZ domain-containing protein [Fusarium oxysporum f. sp. phaseoli]